MARFPNSREAKLIVLLARGDATLADMRPVAEEFEPEIPPELDIRMATAQLEAGTVPREEIQIVQIAKRDAKNNLARLVKRMEKAEKELREHVSRQRARQEAEKATTTKGDGKEDVLH